MCLLLYNVLFLTLCFSVYRANAVVCGDHSTDMEGKIERPYTNSYFSSSFQCIWTVTVPQRRKIELHAQQFSIIPPRDGICHSDFVLVESLTSDDKSVSHGKFCGNLMPIITSLENRLRILYYHVSEAYNQKFRLEYKTVPLSLRELTELWIKYHVVQFFEPKENLPRAVSALYMFDERYFNEGNETGTDITTQFYLQLSVDLVRNLTRPMLAADLAHHINALLAICSNPASFHGVDLVNNLRYLVNMERGLINPYLFLTMCNAGDKMTSSDITKLFAIAGTHKDEMFWTDFQAVALMALVCINEHDDRIDLEFEISESSKELSNQQLPNGTFGSLQTTSLAVQALQAAGCNESTWNKSSAMKFIANANNTDGSFANLHDLYAVIPVIVGKNLMHLNASRCDFTTDGLIPVREIKNNLTNIIEVVYRVWMGDHIDFSTSMAVKASYGTSFMDFMRLAGEQDKRFRFQWIYVKHVSHVYQLFGVVNDPASGRYWTLLTGRDGRNIQPFKKGLEHYIPHDGDVAILWYRTVTIEHSLPENETTTEWPITTPSWKEWTRTDRVTKQPLYNETWMPFWRNSTRYVNTSEWSLDNETSWLSLEESEDYEIDNSYTY